MTLALRSLFPDTLVAGAATPPAYEHNKPLRELNSFGVAAHARHWWSVQTWSELPGLLTALRQTAGAQPPLIWGGGSNVLVLGDVTQPVVHIGLQGKRIVAERDPTVLIEAAAGESWDGLVRWSLAQGLAGLENLALIPGTVGAAPIQNIGAYGVELREVLESVLAMDLRDGQLRRFDGPECALSYRDSMFKHGAGRDWLILAVRLKLSRRAQCRLDYADLRAALAAIKQPTPQDVATAVTALRRSKLPDPAVLGNAGSFFKNPLTSRSHAAALQQQYPGLPVWPLDNDRAKLSAAWMIDQLGWKGHRKGDAGVHAHHALVLVNHGQASGRAVWALAEQISASVQARFGVALEPEPERVGG